MKLLYKKVFFATKTRRREGFYLVFLTFVEPGFYFSADEGFLATKARRPFRAVRPLMLSSGQD